MMIVIEMRIVLISLVLEARFAIRTEKEANIIINMMFWAIPARVVSGLRRNVMPSTIRKNAIINLFRMIISILFEMFSAFLMALSKFGFLGI